MVRAPIRILLVEDHRLMFEGLTSLLSEYADMNVLGVATTVADAVDKAIVLKPDLVLMDYRLPDGDGSQAADRIRSKLPDTAVVFLSADLSEAAMMRAVEAGAAGYVSKGASAEELVSAVRKAADGEFLVAASTDGLTRLGPAGICHWSPRIRHRIVEAAIVFACARVKRASPAPN